MKNTIVIASNNPGKKLEYIRLAELFQVPLTFLTMEEVDIVSNPEEDGTTYEENALIKARACRSQTSYAVLADDAGIEIAVLGPGRPGVHSHRYLSANGYDLESIAGRAEGSRALFHCTIAYIDSVGEYVCSGEIEGTIVRPRGKSGFGFDPIFLPDGFTETFAELGSKKDMISHRGKAFQTFLNYGRMPVF